jgi:hypothetical protein
MTAYEYLLENQDKTLIELMEGFAEFRTIEILAEFALFVQEEYSQRDKESMFDKYTNWKKQQ